jgi:hypothetical protein
MYVVFLSLSLFLSCYGTSMRIIDILIYVLVALGQEDDVIISFVYVQVQECTRNNLFLLLCFSPPL